MGLLLNNLSVYSGCEIALDSFEVPETRMRAQASLEEGSERLDLSFMKDALEDVLNTLKQEPELTRTLKEIVKLLNDPRRVEYEAELAHVSRSSQSPKMRSGTGSPTAEVDAAHDNDPGAVFNQIDDEHEDDFHYNKGIQGVDASPNSGSSGYAMGEQEDTDGSKDESPGIFLSQDPVDWLPISSGVLVKSNAWAGPDHWKYAKLKEDIGSKNADNEGIEKAKHKRKEPFAFDFLNPPGVDLSNFDPPSNPCSLGLPQSVAPSKTLLPKDHHFEATSLTKFFLRPAVLIVHRRRKKRSVSFGQLPNDDGNNLFED